MNKKRQRRKRRAKKFFSVLLKIVGIGFIPAVKNRLEKKHGRNGEMAGEALEAGLDALDKGLNDVTD